MTRWWRAYRTSGGATASRPWSNCAPVPRRWTSRASRPTAGPGWRATRFRAPSSSPTTSSVRPAARRTTAGRERWRRASGRAEPGGRGARARPWPCARRLPVAVAARPLVSARRRRPSAASGPAPPCAARPGAAHGGPARRPRSAAARSTAPSGHAGSAAMARTSSPLMRLISLRTSSRSGRVVGACAGSASHGGAARAARPCWPRSGPGRSAPWPPGRRPAAGPAPPPRPAPPAHGPGRRSGRRCPTSPRPPDRRWPAAPRTARRAGRAGRTRSARQRVVAAAGAVASAEGAVAWADRAAGAATAPPVPVSRTAAAAPAVRALRIEVISCTVGLSRTPGNPRGVQRRHRP